MKVGKKLIFVALTVVAVILAAPHSAYAIDVGEITDDLMSDFTEALPDGFKTQPTDPQALGESVGLRAVLSELVSALRGEGGGVVSFFLVALGFSFLVSFTSLLPSVSDVTECAVGAVGVAIVLERLYPAVAHARDCLTESAAFFEGVIPVMMGVHAASGGVGTAAAQGAAMSLTVSLIAGGCVNLLLPLAAFGGVMGLIGSLGDSGAPGIGVGVRNLFLWLTGIACTLISGTTALQTVIASAHDTATVRAMKYGAGSLLPIVGGTVSSALTTLTAGVSYLKSAMGVTSVAVILSVMLSPLVILLLYRGAISLVITVSGFFGSSAAVGMLSSIRASVDTVCAVFSLCAVTYVIQLTLFMRGGVVI